MLLITKNLYGTVKNSSQLYILWILRCVFYVVYFTLKQGFIYVYANKKILFHFDLQCLNIQAVADKKEPSSKMGRLVYDGYKIKKMLTEVMFLYSTVTCVYVQAIIATHSELLE